MGNGNENINGFLISHTTPSYDKFEFAYYYQHYWKYNQR